MTSIWTVSAQTRSLADTTVHLRVNRSGEALPNQTLAERKAGFTPPLGSLSNPRRLLATRPGRYPAQAIVFHYIVMKQGCEGVEANQKITDLAKSLMKFSSKIGQRLI